MSSLLILFDHLDLYLSWIRSVNFFQVIVEARNIIVKSVSTIKNRWRAETMHSVRQYYGLRRNEEE